MNKIELVNFMKSHKLSSSDLSEITNVSLRTVKSWEYGERNISKSALKLLESYKNDPDGFINRKPTGNNINSNTHEKSQKSFQDLSLEEKLNYMYQDSIEREQRLNDKIESLEEKLILSQLINRTYLRSLVAKAKINKEELKKAEFEDNLIH